MNWQLLRNLFVIENKENPKRLPVLETEKELPTNAQELLEHLSFQELKGRAGGKTRTIRCWLKKENAICISSNDGMCYGEVVLEENWYLPDARGCEPQGSHFYRVLNCPESSYIRNFISRFLYYKTIDDAVPPWIKTNYFNLPTLEFDSGGKLINREKVIKIVANGPVTFWIDRKHRYPYSDDWTTTYIWGPVTVLYDQFMNISPIEYTNYNSFCENEAGYPI